MKWKAEGSDNATGSDFKFAVLALNPFLSSHDRLNHPSFLL